MSLFKDIKHGIVFSIAMITNMFRFCETSTVSNGDLCCLFDDQLIQMFTPKYNMHTTSLWEI